MVKTAWRKAHSLLNLKRVQERILKHHGGDGDHARSMITSSYERRHDDDFWDYWNSHVACNYESGDTIVDLGAGVGQFITDCSERYPESDVIGIEAASHMLNHQLFLPRNAKLIADDLQNPSVEIEFCTAGMVMANLLVHELSQPIKMFMSVYDWLKPGGRFCVIDVTRQPLKEFLVYRYKLSPWSEETSLEEFEETLTYYQEHNRYHPEDILTMLELVGFNTIDMQSEGNGRFVRMVVEKPLSECCELD